MIYRKSGHIYLIVKLPKKEIYIFFLIHGSDNRFDKERMLEITGTWLLAGSTYHRSMCAYSSTMPSERVIGKRFNHIFSQRSYINHDYQLMSSR